MLTRSLLEVKMVEISGWSEFFKEISTLVDGAERQYGIANLNGSTEVDGPNAEKIQRAKLKHSFQLARVKGRHR